MARARKSETNENNPADPWHPDRQSKPAAEVLEHVDEPPRPRSMLAEAQVLLTIAEILEPFSDEQRCRIMAAACGAIGEYDYAEAFIRGAKQASKKQRTAEARGEGERPAWEDP